MAVLVEAISVVIRRDAVDSKYPGGFTAFAEQAPFLATRDTLVTDGELVSISFMAPADSERFCTDLVRLGFHPASEPVDLVVVDQHTGPTVPCDWIDGFQMVLTGGGEVGCARLVGGTVTELFVPDGWTYEDSLTANHSFVPLEAVGERYFFAKADGALEEWRDSDSGKPGWIERPISPASGQVIPKALA